MAAYPVVASKSEEAAPVYWNPLGSVYEVLMVAASGIRIPKGLGRCHARHPDFAFLACVDLMHVPSSDLDFPDYELTAPSSGCSQRHFHLSRFQRIASPLANAAWKVSRRRIDRDCNALR